MCVKSVNSYPGAWDFVLDCYITQKMGDKAASTHSSAIQFVP